MPHPLSPREKLNGPLLPRKERKRFEWHRLQRANLSSVEEALESFCVELEPCMPIKRWESYCMYRYMSIHVCSNTTPLWAAMANMVLTGSKLTAADHELYQKRHDCEDVDVEELLCEDFLSRWGCEGRAEVELRLLFYQQVLMRPEALTRSLFSLSVSRQDFAEDPKFFHLVAGDV